MNDVLPATGWVSLLRNDSHFTPLLKKQRVYTRFANKNQSPRVSSFRFQEFSSLLHNKTVHALCLVLFIGLILRFWGGLSTVLFTYDQSRDAFIALGITHGDLKVVGPASDIPGLFHGPLYYYFIAPFYALGGGDPRVTVVWMIITNLLTSIPLYILAQKLFKNTAIAMLTVLLFMVSYEAVSYARWLSNPALALPAMALFYLGLWMVITREKLGWILLGVGLGLSIQSEIFLVYLFAVSLVALVLFRIKPFAYRYIGRGVLALVILLTSFALAEIKFHFQGVKGLLGFFTGQSQEAGTFVDHLNNYTNRFTQLWQLNLFPLSSNVALLLALLCVGFAIYKIGTTQDQRKPLLFVLLLLFSHLIIFLVSGVNAVFINVGVGFSVLLLTAFVLQNLTAQLKYGALLLLAVIIVGNVVAITRDNEKGSVLFQVQKNMRLSDEIALVKETYTQANGKPFGVTAITNPLFVPTTWAHMYNWYASENNLAVPFYRGNAASAYAGDTVFPRSDALRDVEFVIQEPQPSIPDGWIKTILAEEAMRGPFTSKKEFGTFTLYTRIRSATKQ